MFNLKKVKWAGEMAQQGKCLPRNWIPELEEKQERKHPFIMPGGGGTQGKQRQADL